MGSPFAGYSGPLSQGKRLLARDVIGAQLGLADVGDIWYVDAGNGSDTAYKKNDPDQPLATVGAALAAATADQDDVIVITGSNSTGRTSESAIIDWNKRRTHIVGNGPPRKINQRQGIGVAASASSGFTVSANNCMFANISIAAFADTDVMVEVTGDYNTFMNVHFQGIGHATPAGETGARALLLTGAEENEFYSCTFGLDTVERTAANATVEQTGTCARNKYVDCDFLIFVDGSSAAAVHFKADTGNCYERYLIFDRCNFLNADTASSTTLTTAFDLSTTGNGTVFLRDSWSKGASDWANNFDALFLTMPIADTDDGGLTKIGT